MAPWRTWQNWIDPESWQSESVSFQTSKVQQSPKFYVIFLWRHPKCTAYKIWDFFHLALQSASNLRNSSLSNISSILISKGSFHINLKMTDLSFHCLFIYLQETWKITLTSLTDSLQRSLWFNSRKMQKRLVLRADVATKWEDDYFCAALHRLQTFGWCRLVPPTADELVFTHLLCWKSSHWIHHC